jgi:uncharacterized protein (TIGR04551 family)
MRKVSLAVTAIAGLVSWSVLAEAQDAPKPPAVPAPPVAPAAPAAAPAPTHATPAAAPKTTPAASPKKDAATQPSATTAPAPSATPDAETAPPSDAPAPTPDTAAASGEAPSLPPAQPTPPAAGISPIGIWPGQTPPPSTTPPPVVPEVSSDEVFAEDWWSHARPVFELHGYFRTRAELFHNFSLGRVDNAIWPQPIDNTYTPAVNGNSGSTVGPTLCTPAESGGPSTYDNPADSSHPLQGCRNKTQAGANLRFRLDPELHISDNLRIVSQIDLLDNVVMGSTPSTYAFMPASGGGYQVAGGTANGVTAETTVPPTAGVNSLSNSIAVKRVWAEYTTPVGELRFGRMPDHFGLGMVHNSGDGYDDDYQSTVDRLQFITSIKPLDLYIGGMWDFPNEGVISQPTLPGGQAYDLSQLDDVNQWSLIVMRKTSPELVNTALSRGQVVLNGGAYVTLRKQLLADDQNASSGRGTAATGGNVPNATTTNYVSPSGYARRNANIWTPDLWLQLKYKKFRFEAEGAAVLGRMDSDSQDSLGSSSTPYLTSARTFREFGFATELEQKLVEDKLRLGFNFGWASGDSNAYNSDTTNNLIAEPTQQPVNSSTVSTFRFNPAYRIDLILNRNLLQRIQGTYYFKPSVEYDFMRKPSGQRLGGGAGVIWTRASDYVQTPGHARDLGVELDGRLYFQSKDGNLNDKPGRMGGFYAMLEYGVLFPLAGLGYQESERNKLGGASTSAAQILRMYLGVLF